MRRQLLLPPGWVALGFLLLLGCQALQPWEHQLKLYSVVRLTMPPLKADTSYLHFLKKYKVHILKDEYDPYATAWSTHAAITLQKMRPWYDTEFRGSELLDFLNLNATEFLIRKIIADTSHAGGVRIRFWPGATYANLVGVLGLMNYTGQKKYWLDIRHYPTTLYAITTKPAHEHEPLLFSCGTRYIEPHLPPKKIGFEELITEFWRK